MSPVIPVFTIYTTFLTSFICFLTLLMPGMCFESLTSNMTTTHSGSLVSKQLRAFIDCQGVVKLRPDDKTWDGEGVYCGPQFDGVGCWDASAPGTETRISCPHYVSGSDPNKSVLRKCLENGTWAINQNTGKDEGDYSSCDFSVYPSADEGLLQRLFEEISKLDSNPYEDLRTTLAFEECIERILSKPLPEDGHVYCPRTFDGWGCWNDTFAGDNAYIPCPSFMPGFNPERQAFKVCLEDGSWFRHPLTNKTWSNYTTCIDQDDLSFRQKINNLYIAGYSISVIALLISLAIFFSFTSLRCTRIAIHKNLFISFIINNTMWIIWYTCVIYRPEVIVSNKIQCQALHVVVHYFLVCNYFWMFCEGLYLHTLLVVAFVSEDKILKWFYVIGWGVPLILIIVYASLRGTSPQDTILCWIEESKYTWCLNGPVCVSIMLNLVFLINIVRVLVTKLRAVNSPDAHQTRKAVRATLILIPLLGLQYMLTPFRPPQGSPAEAIYEMLAAASTSFQVLAQMRKKWTRHVLSRGRDDRRTSYAATSVSYIPKCNGDAQAMKPLKENGWSS